MLADVNLCSICAPAPQEVRFRLARILERAMQLADIYDDFDPQTPKFIGKRYPDLLVSDMDMVLKQVLNF